MTMTIRPTPHAKRRPVRVLARSAMPVTRIRDSRGIFELTEALESAEAALVIWKLRGWLIHNQAKNAHISYRDGRWWSFRSLEKWCERDFKWLTPRQLGTIMKKLEAMKVITRRQYGARKLKMSYWYSINEDVVEELIANTKRANAFDDSVKSSDSSVESSDENVEYKTVVKQKNNNQNKNPKTKQQQPTAQTAVVVGLPSSEPEAESGEYSIDGEGQDATAVKAFMPHEQHQDKEPFPKVPLKGFSALTADLVKFNVLPVTAQRLVDQYPEADVRYVLDYARGESSLRNPPGFVVDELDTRKHGVLAKRDLQKDLQSTPSPTRFIPPDDFVCTDEEREEIGLIGFDRFIALRRENDRIGAEYA